MPSNQYPEVDFDVLIPEVFTRKFRVKATSVEDAIRKVEAGGGQDVTGSLDHQVTLDSKRWRAAPCA